MTFQEWYAQPEIRRLVEQTAHEELAVDRICLLAWNAARLDVLERDVPSQEHGSEEKT